MFLGRAAIVKPGHVPKPWLAAPPKNKKENPGARGTIHRPPLRGLKLPVPAGFAEMGVRSSVLCGFSG